MEHVFILLAFASMSSGVAQISEFVPADGLVVWFLNGNAFDESGNAAHGTIHGAAPTEDRNGVSSAALHFDGQSWVSASPLVAQRGRSAQCERLVEPFNSGWPFTLTAVAYGAPSTSCAFMVGLFNQHCGARVGR